MEINKLKTLRAAHRSATTRLLNKIEDAKENSDADVEEVAVLFNKLALKEVAFQPSQKPLTQGRFLALDPRFGVPAPLIFWAL